MDTAFDQTIRDLENQLGPDPEKWYWSRVHVLEHKHPIGKSKPLKAIFNVGPFPIAGGNETLNQQGFELTGEGIYKTRFGPAMRRSLDFADPEHAWNILPTGNSGNFMSRHYDDQAKLFNEGKTRPELMDRKDIERVCKDKLTLRPVNSIE